MSSTGLAFLSAIGLGLISTAGGALGMDSAADDGLISGAAEMLTVSESGIWSGTSVSVSRGRAVLKPTPESLVSRLSTPTSLEETSRPCVRTDSRDETIRNNQNRLSF